MNKNKNYLFILGIAICGAFLLYSKNAYADSLKMEQGIFHRHSGGSSGGGCYTEKHVTTEEIEVPCGGSMHYWPELGTSQCTVCGASYHGDQSGRSCWHSTTKTISDSYYTLGCGQDESTVLGKLYLEKSTEEWTKRLYLKASYELGEQLSVHENPYIWNGGEATNADSYEIQQNGTYKLKLNLTSDKYLTGSELQLEINNIDVTAPVISYFFKEGNSWVRDAVTVKISNAKDLQPNGEEGSGLHETPYSFDGGKTWTQEETFLYTQNGEFEILVKDRLENVATYPIQINQIDQTGPTLKEISYDKSANCKEVKLLVSAVDIQEDGTEGVGLHKLAFSYDGGETWEESSSITIINNQRVLVVVRDQLMNETKKEITITNIDSYGPKIQYRMEAESWTNQDVELYLTGTDLGYEENMGSGLPEYWYSLDEGVTWKKEEVLVYTENTDLKVVARDLLGNQSNIDISITQIDKDPPCLEVEKRIEGTGKEKRICLIIHASDEYSGLSEAAYSWNGGQSYGNNSNMEITENGSYEICVRDRAGNDNSQTVIVDEFEYFEADNGKEEEKEKEREKEERKIEPDEEEEEGKKVEVTLPIFKKSEMNTEIVKKSQKENKMQAKEIVKIDEPVLKIKEKLTEEPHVIERNKLAENPFIEIMTIAGIIGVLAILGFLCYHTVLLFEKVEGRYLIRGLLWIKNQDGISEISINEKKMENCITTNFMFCLSFLFSYLHKGKIINLNFPKKSITEYVENKIFVNLI